VGDFVATQVLGVGVDFLYLSTWGVGGVESLAGGEEKNFLSALLIPFPIFLTL
jgi:multisubunit Na+/H+ antiporter MnhB subunit